MHQQNLLGVLEWTVEHLGILLRSCATDIYVIINNVCWIFWIKFFNLYKEFLWFDELVIEYRIIILRILLEWRIN